MVIRIKEFITDYTDFHRLIMWQSAKSAGNHKPHKEQKQKFSVIIWIKVFTNDYMDFHRLILWRSAKSAGNYKPQKEQ